MDTTYNPTQPGDPGVLNPATQMAKCYANYAQNYRTRLDGHRTTQFNGRGIQVSTDDERRNPVTGTSKVEMLKHPQ